MPLAEIIDIAFTARPATISFEVANPRHVHEWALFERVNLPDGKIIIPGVIVVWAKLSTMAEGARLATKQFWGV